MSQTTIQRLKTLNSLFLFRISLLSFHCLLTLFDSVRMCVFIPKKTERFVRCASSAFRKPIIEIHRFIMTFSEHCCMVSRQCVSVCHSSSLAVFFFLHFGAMHLWPIVQIHKNFQQFFFLLPEHAHVRVDCSHLCNFPFFPCYNR